jgi:hypothetical protein
MFAPAFTNVVGSVSDISHTGANRHGRTVLFPIRVDDAVMGTTEQWAHDIRRTRHIGDFSRWKEHGAYQMALDRLLRDLRVEKT